MSLFYGVSLTCLDFFTLLVQQDDTFTLQLLDYIQTRAKEKGAEQEWRAARGYTRADVLLDLDDTTFARAASVNIQDLIRDIRVVRYTPNKNIDIENPEMQVSLWPGLDISNSTPYQETYLVGRHIQVYDEENLARCCLPDLTPLDAELAKFFPNEQADFQ